MRSLLVLTAVLALAAAAAPVPSAQPSAAGDPVFVLTGGGWGHNVGLSQWGAYGQAQAGRTYDRILRSYFPGTRLERSPLRRVRVLLGDGLRRVTVSSTAPFRVRDGTGVTHDVARTEIRLGPALRVPLLEPSASPQAAPTVRRPGLAPPLTFLPARGATLAVDGKGVRGRLVLGRDAQTLRVVMEVALDAYVMGIVPGEMPREWPLEALKAQAVAARTYALSKLEQGKEWDVVADPVAFGYYGVQSESPSTTRAVRETRGEVLTYGGKPITAFYFSSSGGRTFSSQDVFGTALPYLPGVPDPWDEASPHNRWPPRTFTPVSLARALGVPAPVTDVQVVPSAPGRPLAYRLASAAGPGGELRAADLRVRLGLKSPNFRLGVLRLEPVLGAVPPGGEVTLEGVARDVGEAVLEQRVDAGGWKQARKLVLQPDGSFVVVLRPATTTRYRLAAAGLIGPALTVRVSGQAGD